MYHYANLNVINKPELCESYEMLYQFIFQMSCNKYTIQNYPKYGDVLNDVYSNKYSCVVLFLFSTFSAAVKMSSSKLVVSPCCYF